MKIAQFIDTLDVGGAETMLVRLAKAQQKSGHEVVIFHLGSHYLVNVCKENNLQQQIIPKPHWYKSLKTILLFTFKFSALLKKQKFDVLHTHLYGPISGCFLGCAFHKIKHVGTLHDVYSVDEGIGRARTLKLAQTLNTRLVAVSSDMQRFYQQKISTNVPLAKIHNGVSIPTDKKNVPDPFLKILNSNYSKTVLKIITVGRLIPLKRQIQQLKFMSNFIKNNDVQLFFVGDGPLRIELEKTIESLNLTDKVFVLGTRNDVSELLSYSDIFVLASKSEGLSCSIVEAMGASLACVVSDVGGNRELIKNNINGFVFAKDDFSGLVTALETLKNSSTLRVKMGELSFARAKESFSINAMENSYQQLYLK